MNSASPPSPPHKDFPVSWEDIHRHAKALAWKLGELRPMPQTPWRGIIAITRGGLVPACIVARELDIRRVDTLCASSYEDIRRQGELEILKKPMAEAGDGEGWIVIDDLADTGKTFRAARALLPRAHFACIYVKPAGAATADTHILEVSQDTWIYFPWEMS